jgi:hypothetical protein
VSQPQDWGRVGDDGTVYVRTPTGEQQVGSWQAGSPDEALAYYGRRYDELATEVDLMARRLPAGTADPKRTRSRAAELRAGLARARVVGDLAALDDRLDALLAEADRRIELGKADRERRAKEAEQAKTALAEEAEQLSESTSWKTTGDRYRAIVEEWRTIRGLDRRTDAGLWKRMSAARSRFSKRRTAHFAEQGRRREQARDRKEDLIAEAEALRESTEWGPTSAKHRELMAAWKQAGPAPRAAERELWGRFRAARQAFFEARAHANSKRADEHQANAARRKELLGEAESLDPGKDLPGARRALRSIQHRWEQAGPVPRNEQTRLDRRLADAEAKVRETDTARRQRGPDPQASAFAERLRESVDKLESKAERARAAGRHDEAAEAEDSLATQRAWLQRADSA